jgi:maleate isomerase
MVPAFRPGARGRIGVIQPAPGVMLEHEWPAYLPPGVLFPVGRIRLPSADAAGYQRIAEEAPEIARDLASAGAGVIAYACTIGSLSAGASAERALTDRIAAAAGKPAISLASACIEALRWVGANRIAILTPYGDESNRWVADYAREQGLEVDALATTPVDIRTVGDLPPPAIAALAIETLNRAFDADALWLPCTAMQTMAAIPFIEAVTRRPVISGAQALLWRALEILKIADPISNAGRLFG